MYWIVSWIVSCTCFANCIDLCLYCRETDEKETANQGGFFITQNPKRTEVKQCQFKTSLTIEN